MGKGESAADGRAQVETALDVAEKCSTTLFQGAASKGQMLTPTVSMIHLHGMEAVTANSDDTVVARTQLLSPHARQMPTRHTTTEGTLTHRLLENSAAAAVPKFEQPFPKEEPPKTRAE